MLNGTVEHNLKNAEKLIKKDDIENASKIYNDILTKFPKNLRAIHSLNKLREIEIEKKINLIDYFYSNGKLIDAERESDKLLIEGKNNIKFLRILGTIKAELGKLKEAENIFYELLKIDQSDPTCCKLVGYICIHLHANSHEYPNMFRRVMAEIVCFGVQ